MRVEFQRRVDRLVGVPLCRVLSLFPRAWDRAEDSPPPRKILLILLSEMGSLVVTRPMLSRLQEKFPDATLHALVFRQNREVLDLLGAIPRENIFTIRNDSFGALLQDAVRSVAALRRAAIDTVIDCELFSRVSAILSFLSGARRRVGFHIHTQEGLYRGGFINRPVLYNPYQHISHQFVTLADAVDGTGRPLAKREVSRKALEIPSLPLDDGELDAMSHRLTGDFPSVSRKRLVLLYPGGGLLPVRAWPIESFRELAKGLVDARFLIGIIGLAEDREASRRIREACGEENAIDLTGYTRTVRELMVLFHLAELLVTNDGGPGHFAAMTPIQSIVLYGPETPVLYGSLSPTSVPFYRNLSCSPCLTAYNHRHSPCDGDNQCLKGIPSGDVLARALELLEEKKAAVP